MFMREGSRFLRERGGWESQSTVVRKGSREIPPPLSLKNPEPLLINRVSSNPYLNTQCGSMNLMRCIGINLLYTLWAININALVTFLGQYALHTYCPSNIKCKTALWCHQPTQSVSLILVRFWNDKLPFEWALLILFIRFTLFCCP